MFIASPEDTDFFREDSTAEATEATENVAKVEGGLVRRGSIQCST